MALDEHALADVKGVDGGPPWSLGLHSFDLRMLAAHSLIVPTAGKAGSFSIFSDCAF